MGQRLLILHLSAEAQAKLTPEELRTQKEQNEAIPQRLLSHTYEQIFKSARKWFMEFMEDQHPEIQAETAYFQPGCAEPDRILMQEYARYIARSRVGLYGGPLAVNTVIGYINSCISVMERDSKRQFNPELRQTLGRFISNNLVTQEGLSTAMKPKLSANSEDVSYIMSRLFDAQYLNTFGNMRQVLNLTLYLMLIVDSCGRGGEFVLNPARPKHMCLMWKDVDLYSFHSVEDNAFDIRINITINWSKNDNLDDSKYKTIPSVKLLPISMVSEKLASLA
ncbi:hypothetical protein LB507_003665 [Fusarium sp. FIESC RH6]|nr:hypothetical protein LB507_003665 [Fusarium sp. FIESC RH6]